MPATAAALLAAVLVPWAGCGGEGPRGGNGGAPEVKAENLLQARCTRCHGLERVQSHRFDRAGWERVVGEMVEKGARLDPEEREQVVDFLTRRDAGRPAPETPPHQPRHPQGPGHPGGMGSNR